MKNFICFTSKLLGFNQAQCSDNRPIWVFGEWLGNGKYFDNSKCLFEYVSQGHPEIRAIWLTKDKANLEHVRNKGFESYLSNSLKGCWVTLLSQVGFCTHHPRTDLNPLCLINGSKLVQLWHGIPLKRIALDDKNFIFNKKPFRKPYVWAKNKILENYAMIIASSDENKRRFASAFMMPEERIKITGYPRNDLLFSHSKDKDRIQGIYMPTFREKTEANTAMFEDFGDNMKKIDAFLGERNIVLKLKIHPFRLPPAEFFEKLKNFDHIKLYEGGDIYSRLSQFDFLITDYSSIYFDYLLLDKPIIFSAFDLDDFLSKDRGFYYKFEDVIPGPNAKSWDEVITYIDAVINDPDQFSNERARVREQFHKYRDGNSSERVFHEVLQLIKTDNS